MPTITPQPLTAAAFSPFGDVVEAPEGAATQDINAGTCRRYDALARVDVAAGETGLSIFRAVARTFPLAITLLERHPLGSQAFMPLAAARFVIVVAPDAGDAPDWAKVQAFTASPGQGVNFHRNVWHHPLITVGADGDFLVVDRLSEKDGDNLQESPAPAGEPIQLALD